MKKLVLLILLLPIFLLGQITPTNPWLRRGNSSVSNDWFGSKDSSQVVFKANNSQVMKLKSFAGNNTFTWYQGGSGGYKSNITFRDLSTFSFSVATVYLGTPVETQGALNYFAWSDTSTVRINAPSVLSFNTNGANIFNGSTTAPPSGRYVNFPAITNATTALNGNKTHIFVGGCTYGFNGTATVSPIKIAISADTFTANSVATITTAITVDIPKPVAGASITITNPIALRVTGVLADNGNASFGASIPTPSASVHIGGQTTSNPAMFFATGSLLTTTVNGAVEWNAGQMYATNATNRYKVGYFLTGSATLNFPSTLTAAVSDLTLTVTGASLNDVVDVGVPNGAITATATFFAWVSATDVVTVRFSHNSVGSEDPASGTFKVTVNKN